MNLFDDLLSGSARGELQNFIQRYEQGDPREGYSEQEALDRYQQVATVLPTAQYIQAAEAALERLSPQQRQQFGQLITTIAEQNGISIPGLSASTPARHLQNSGVLAQTLGLLHQQQPELLARIAAAHGNAPSTNLMSNSVVKAALGGIAAMAAKQALTRQQH